jgi:sterol desaturase/sphingolipid hydroxylase (fatty acid hydroxylase superfamily)
VTGEAQESPQIQKALGFLLKHQNPNGGWGEDFTSCYNKDYAPNGMCRYGHECSGTVPTAWALLALMCGGCKNRQSIDAGIAYLISRQLLNGDWEQEGILGVFNRACGITYSSYRNIFPVWALCRYAHHYGTSASPQLPNLNGLRDSSQLLVKEKNSSRSTKSEPKYLPQPKIQQSLRSFVELLISITIAVSVGVIVRDPKSSWPSPTGLVLGVLTVLSGQVLVITYYVLRRWGALHMEFIQPLSGVPSTPLFDQIAKHVCNPEGFLLLTAYLSITWIFSLMPASYYSLEGSANWLHVLVQMLVVDFIQFMMHWLEHKVSPTLYRYSHKPHHFVTNPKLTDSFSGSLFDTLIMILLPLYLTALIVHCNAWSYMAFGSLYSSSLCLIHTEFTNPWDPIFRVFGIGE